MTRDEVLSALRAGAEREFAAVPAEGELTWEPSPGFRTRMETLVRQERRFLWRRTSTSLRRAALVAALLLLLLATLITAGAFQEPEFRVFTQSFGDHLDVTFGENASGDTDTFYGDFVPCTFTELPDGYAEESFVMFAEDFYETTWKNADGGLLILDQCFAGRADHSVDNEHGQVDIRTINGIETWISAYEGESLLFWASGQYAFTLAVYDTLPMETLERMICSLTERQKPFVWRSADAAAGGEMKVSYGVNAPGDTRVAYGPCEPYTFAWLPEGFEETSFTILDGFKGYDGAFCETVWTNAEGTAIDLCQGPVSNSAVLDISAGEYQLCTVNGTEVLLYHGRDYWKPFAPDYLRAFWAAEQYSFTLSVEPAIEPETVLEMVASLTRRSE